MKEVTYEVEKTESGIKRMQAYAELLKTVSDKKTKDSTGEKKHDDV